MVQDIVQSFFNDYSVISTDLLNQAIHTRAQYEQQSSTTQIDGLLQGLKSLLGHSNLKLPEAED